MNALPKPQELPEGIIIEDFRAYLPAHTYIYEPTGDMWPASSINSKLTGSGKKKASEWLDDNRAVVQMTWSPAEPKIITGKVIADGGWLEKPGVDVFNQYREPNCRDGDPNNVEPWLKHIASIYPDNWEHIGMWLAHRCQRPGEKINHCLVMGGAPGIGKDTLLEPVKHAVGQWNWQEVQPPALLGRFNGFVKSVVLRISEGRDLGDLDRYAFYEHTKVFMASPPDVLRCDEKHLREYSVVNVMGVIITTNNKSSGIYLPSDDRRHYVAWSPLTQTPEVIDECARMWQWYASGGLENVVAFLRRVNLSKFDPKAPPPKTQAFYEIVDANRSPEDSELADTLEKMRSPDALTVARLCDYASDDFEDWLKDRRNRRLIPHRLESVGYVPVRNTGADQGLWKIDGKRQTAYAKKTLSYRDQCVAVQRCLIERAQQGEWFDK